MSKSNNIFWIDGSRRNDDFYNVYTVDSVMGKGVTSTVFRCKNKLTQGECAAKVIQKMGQGKRKKVISSEVEALLQLNHPNIVKMLDIFESMTEVYIVLELAAGGELFDRIVKKGHYSEKEAARVCYQVLSALEYSHGKGIAHRDIKPENILYSTASDDSLLKISDFGFAKNMEDGIMQTFCGTIGYCAPEVVLKKPYGPSVDLWSLGVVLYILLCGTSRKRPHHETPQTMHIWDVGGEVGVTRKIVYGDYEFESPYWDEISVPAKEFVRQLMTVDPEKRPTATQALRNCWVQGNVARDTPLTGAQERIREFNAKRKFKAATNAVVAFNRITGGAYAHSQSQSLSPEK